MKMLYEDYGPFQLSFPSDCGNAPKRKQLKEVAASAFLNRIEEVSDYLAENFSYTVVGKGKSGDKALFLEKVSLLAERQPTEVILPSVITHGRTAALECRANFKKGSPAAYAVFIEFTSAGKQAKIKKAAIYIVQTKNERGD